MAAWPWPIHYAHVSINLIGHLVNSVTEEKIRQEMIDMKWNSRDDTLDIFWDAD